MRPSDDRTYRITEFAQLAGITTRALRHYDQLGLLKPKRTKGGYRAYSARDFERLEQIIALKFIGVPLKKVGFFTVRTPEGLARALRAQRQTLIEKRHLLEKAINAIGEVEQALLAGGVADTALYRRIIEAIEMQNNNDEWNKKYEALVNAKVERLKALSPDTMAELRGEWATLVAAIQQSLHEDPAGPKAQALAAKWVRLLERLMGGPVDPSMMGFAAAYQNEERKDLTARFGDKDKNVWDFMSKALAARR